MPGATFLDSTNHVAYRLADANQALPLQSVQFISAAPVVDATLQVITLQQPVGCTPGNCPAIQNGDLLYALLFYPSTTALVSAPAGWVVQDSLAVMGGQSVVLYSHWITVGETGPYTWQLSVSSPCAAMMLGYRGVGAVEGDSGIIQGTGTSAAPGSVSTVLGSELTIAIFTEFGAGNKWSVPSGYVLRAQAPTQSVAWFDLGSPYTAGTSNTFSVTSTESGGSASHWTAHLFALNPAPYCPASLVIADDGAPERIPQDTMNGANSGGYPAYTNTVNNLGSQPHYPNGILSASPLDKGTRGLS